MARATIEKMFSPNIVDSLFETHARIQYQDKLLFSSVFHAMCLVSTRSHKSLHGAYRQMKDSLDVTVKSLYNKVNGVESTVCHSLVRHSADTALTLVKDWIPRMEGVKGYRLKVIDGNHISGTQHRLKVLRNQPAAALPGLSVVVLLPEVGLIEDVIPWEDAYIQETQLLGPVIQRIEAKDLILADRLYCTSDFIFEIAARNACFVIRQHTGHLRWKLIGEPKSLGRTETGQLFEQEVELTHPRTGVDLGVRRITVKLDQPTRNKDEELHILTNLPASDATAQKVAELYRKRWTIETAFKEMTTTLQCELNTLGYPAAALFSFSIAAVCFNVLSVIVTALRHTHSNELEHGVSYYALATEVSSTYSGMMIALPAEEWVRFQDMTHEQLCQKLQEWAKQADVSRYKKLKRSSSPKRSKRAYGGKKHVATSRLLSAKKGDPT